MKIALAQMMMSESIQNNYDKTIELIKEAAFHGAHIICFPELQLTPFFPQYHHKDVSQYVMTIDDSYIQGICQACNKYHIYAAVNIYIYENHKQYDMSLLIDDQGKIIGKQKMVHIAQAKQFYEQDYYEPSEEGFQVFDTELGKIGIVVCFDRHYPESIRTSVLKGADFIIVPTANTKAEPMEMFEWEVRVQAFQNSVHIAMCNRVGKENQMEFSGQSFITSCLGNMISKGNDQEMIVYGDIDLNFAKQTREEKTYTQLRRVSLYE